MPIRKLLIANRGEIAVRIIRSARALGIETVQVVSQADRDMLAARLADQVVEIGPAQASKSYLDSASILRAAAKTGADAIHPGYGFLSENPAFAAAVEAAGLIFVGPKAETIRQMGDKMMARQIAIAAGLSIAPGSASPIRGAEDALTLAGQIGFPIMIKAAAGGGGRGIRLAQGREELAQQILEAAREARAAFGDDALYLERFIDRARHVEVQVLGDGESVIHLFERECSLQRRRQKIWEEAPAACLPPATRQALCASAVRLAQSVGYRGAGTLEYLYDADSGEFFFIEMNTRIQVEHPVSEMVTGVDLVAEQLRIAGGERLSLTQADIRLSGHAIECRLNAEDPARDFAPAPGRINGLFAPEGAGVRFDTMLYDGYAVPPFYDSLLGKLIVHGADRAAALERLTQALEQLNVKGIATTLPLHRALSADPAVIAFDIHTRWLESWLAAHPLSSDA